MWAYTHSYDPKLSRILGKYIKMYASVHNDEDVKKAKAAGFTLFAWCDDEKIAAKRPEVKRKLTNGQRSAN